MTKNDALQFCEKGSHEYVEEDILTTVRRFEGKPRDDMYILFQCKVCPSKWVKRI